MFDLNIFLARVPSEIKKRKKKKKREINSKSVGEGENGGRKDVCGQRITRMEECGKGGWRR